MQTNLVNGKLKVFGNLLVQFLDAGKARYEARLRSLRQLAMEYQLGLRHRRRRRSIIVVAVVRGINIVSFHCCTTTDWRCLRLLWVAMIATTVINTIIIIIIGVSTIIIVVIIINLLLAAILIDHCCFLLLGEHGQRFYVYSRVCVCVLFRARALH